MPDLRSMFRDLFKGVNPNKPADLAQITNIRASIDTRITDQMSAEKLASILRSAREGEIMAYLELAEAMEERDPHYYSLLQTRKLAVVGAKWSIECENEEIATALEEELIETPQFRWLVGDLMDAIAKGFAVSQGIWDTTTTPRWQYKAFKRIDPRFFRFDLFTMSELRIRDPLMGSVGRELTPDLIVHYPHLRAGVPIRGGLAMLAAVTWMFKNFTIKDWMAFCEVFGMPIRVGKYTPGVTGEDEKAALRRALSLVGHDAAMLIPDSVALEIVTGRTGTSPYLELAEYFDKQLSKCVLGQTMTSDDGSSLAQASVHEKVRQDIARADALNIAATIKQYVIEPWVRLNFGPDAEVPECYPDTSPPEDLESWTKAAVPWVQAGLDVPSKFIREKLGIPEPEEDEELVRTPEPDPTPDGAAPGKQNMGKTAGGKPAKLAPNAIDPREPGAPLSVDAADALVSATLMDWEPVLVEYKDTIEAIGHEAKDYEDFLRKLQEFTKRTDSNPFVRQLAIEAAKARLLAESAKGNA